MTEDMRYDPDSANSNGYHHVSNGSQQYSPRQKAQFSNGTNSHSLSNGSSSVHANGSTPSIARARTPSFFGHDREEVTRLMIQGLEDLGYHQAANRLSQESGYEVQSPEVASFRIAVLEGDWNEAEALLFGSKPPDGGGGVSISSSDYRGLKFIEGADLDRLRFRMRTQKYLELLESKDLGRALMVLRQELTPLNQERSEVQRLSSLIVNTPDGLRKEAHWDGAMGQSRHLLLQELSRSIAPSVMIPEHRLAVLLDQVKQSQIAHCFYHNPSSSPSLFSDHMCDRSEFPLRNVLALGHSGGEIWSLEFSHNGRYLAASGQAADVLIYDTSVFQLLYRLIGHADSVAYLTWSPDDSKLLTCSHDYKAKIWDAASGQCVVTIDYHESNKQAVTTAAWAPDGQSFVTGKLHGDNRLCLWSESGHQLHSWAVNCRVQDCAISPDGRRLVVISNESHIIVYNFATREEEYSIRQKNPMTSIKISKDSRYMLINMASCEVQLIDIETAEMHRRFLGQKQGEYVIRGTFGGADQNLIISGSEDTKIYIWHRENGTLIERLEGHTTGCINVIAWNPTDPCMFASGGDDKKVRIWSKESSDLLTRRSQRLDLHNNSSPH